MAGVGEVEVDRVVADERPPLVDAMIEICRGDPKAIEFCLAWYNFADILDDLFDGDQEVSAKCVGDMVLGVVENLAANPFFQTNMASLLPVMRLGVLNWVESERLRGGGDRDRIAAEVYKGLYCEVLWLSAGLCGGREHQAAMMRKHRIIDWD